MLTTFPLALPAPVAPMSLQICDQRCERGEFGAIFVGRVQVGGIGYRLPRDFDGLHVVGCIEIDERNYERSAECGPESHILFRDRASYVVAWRVARQLKGSHPGRIAKVAWDDSCVRGLCYIVDGAHRLEFTGVDEYVARCRREEAHHG